MTRPRQAAGPTPCADPLAALHPDAVGLIDPHLLTSGHPPAGPDCTPLPAPVIRPGSRDMTALPSRMGNRLHWPDGRITTLGGTPLVQSINGPETL